MGAHLTLPYLRDQKTTWESQFLSFHHVYPRDWIQAINISGRHYNPPSHLTRPHGLCSFLLIPAQLRQGKTEAKGEDPLSQTLYCLLLYCHFQQHVLLKGSRSPVMRGVLPRNAKMQDWHVGVVSTNCQFGKTQSPKDVSLSSVERPKQKDSRTADGTRLWSGDSQKVIEQCTRMDASLLDSLLLETSVTSYLETYHTDFP